MIIEDMFKINDLDKLKITSITAVIHFKYDGEDYFIHTNWESTTSTSLYKGRTKYKNDCLNNVWGYSNNLIKYKKNKKVLSAIDKRNFVKQLYKIGLIDTDIEEIKAEVKAEKEEYKEIKNKIYELNKRLEFLNNN